MAGVFMGKPPGYAVIASEAKQSMLQQSGKLDCFVATLLAMTSVEISSARQFDRRAREPVACQVR
jgi:hypothetical protein